MSTVRVNDNIKKEVLPILNDLGLSLSEAINIYLHQIKLTNGIPFELKYPKFSDEMLESIAEAEEMIKHPENYKSYKNLAEIMEDLDDEETI